MRARLWVSAASHRAMPAGPSIAAAPRRAMRARSVSVSPPAIPSDRSQSPQASEMPGSPVARRRWTIASMAALAAA